MKKFVMKTEVASNLAPYSSNFFIKNGGRRPPFFMKKFVASGANFRRNFLKKWWPKAAILFKNSKNFENFKSLSTSKKF